MTKTHEIITTLLDAKESTVPEDWIQQAARELGILDYQLFKDLPIIIIGRHVERTRCRPKYAITLNKSDDGSKINIRIDDENHLEFWLEIQIPMLKIMNLLGTTIASS